MRRESRTFQVKYEDLSDSAVHYINKIERLETSIRNFLEAVGLLQCYREKQLYKVAGEGNSVLQNASIEPPAAQNRDCSNTSVHTPSMQFNQYLLGSHLTAIAQSPISVPVAGFHLSGAYPQGAHNKLLFINTRKRKWLLIHQKLRSMGGRTTHTVELLEPEQYAALD